MRKDIALPVLALAGGGACLALRRWQLAAALDPETELFRSVPATPVLIGVLALLALLFLVLIQGGGKPEDYPAAFRCPSSLYMTLVTAGSLLLLAAAALGTLGFFRAFQYFAPRSCVCFAAYMLFRPCTSSFYSCRAGTGFIFISGRRRFYRRYNFMDFA